MNCKNLVIDNLNRLRRALVAIGIILALSIVLDVITDARHKSLLTYEQAPVYADSQPQQDAGSPVGPHY